MKKQKTYTKTFQYKRQMINYYNKIKENEKIDFCVCGLFKDTGFTVMYSYKKEV